MCLLLSVILLLGLLTISASAATPVYSDSTIGGVYAVGSCGYSTSSAYATTAHSVISSKYVYVRGTYRIGNEIKYIGSSGYSYDTTPASATVSLPTGASHFLGSQGKHLVIYGNVTWGQVESSIGEQ